MDSPVTAYPQPSTTKSRVRYVDSPALELGEQTGGELETHRHENDAHSYQKFTPLIANYVFYRRWLPESNIWGSWTNPARFGIRSGTFTSAEVADTAVTIPFDPRFTSVPRSVILTPIGEEELGVTFTVTSVGAWNFSMRCSKPSIDFSYIAIM